MDTSLVRPGAMDTSLVRPGAMDTSLVRPGAMFEQVGVLINIQFFPWL